MTTANHDPLDLAYVAAAGRGDNQQAALLEQALEESARPARGGISVAGAAAWYANRGMRVFPVMFGEKRPVPRSHGVKDATTDPQTLDLMFGHGQHWNVGVATGGPYDVLDIDGPDGIAAFASVLGDGAWLTVCGVTQTPRGWHLWVPADPAARNGAGTEHFDFRGQGGYVVAPPSHVNGTVYRWLLPPVPGNPPERDL